ncbi:MAG: small multi-drug export protein, partial [Oscillospiraceae bacterium]|nr:small multi-drug export protein [Oscillospiraceae bacterium]
FRKFCKAFQKKCGPGFAKIIRKAEEKAESIGAYELLGIYLFVAVPLPGTGAWMGTLVASILRIRTWKACLMIALGVLTSGVILMLLCLFAPEAFRFLLGE